MLSVRILLRAAREPSSKKPQKQKCLFLVTQLQSGQVSGSAEDISNGHLMAMI